MADAGPRRRRAHLRALLVVALLLAAAAGATASPARADETPAPVSYLKAYNLDWLAYLDPQDIPPVRYAVCIVDTGVAITPDTPPDNADGPILRRLAVDGGSGEPQGTANQLLHGTRMAFATTAPQNNWGTIGLWPGGNVVSLRGTIANEQFFRISEYPDAINICAKEHPSFPLAAILTSLSCRACSPTADDHAAMADAVAVAHQRGVSIVVAAGNSPGPRHFPAAEPGVVAVTAGNGSGTVCPDVASEPSVALIVAPGCPVETADPLTGIPQAFTDGGSSSASASYASLLSFLRSARPDATWDQAEGWIRDGGLIVDESTVIDGVGAAHEAGLDALVARARTRQGDGTTTASPSVATVTATPVPLGPATAPRHLPAPSDIRIRWRPRRLIVRWPATQRRAQLRVEAIYSGFRRLTVRTARRFKWRLPRKPHALMLVAEPVENGVDSSIPIRYERARGASFRPR